MAKLLIFRIDDGGDYHLIASTETLREAMTEAKQEHTRNPRDEYRVVNPNIGVVEVISAVYDSRQTG